MDSPQRQQIQLGFLTVRKHPSFGFVGGLLVLNGLARPVEFHCTLPIQPTRAQQLLFGATLEEFLAGEQISRALLLKAKAKPSVFLTDTFAALSVRHVVEAPIAALDGSWERNESSLSYPECTNDQWYRFSIGGHCLVMLPDYSHDQSRFEQTMKDMAIDYVEPFGRIEGALMEAHPAAKAA